MNRRLATLLAAIAVVTHCLIGCCVRCANACECVAAETCSASHATCFHCRFAETCCELACQPESNESTATCCHEYDEETPEPAGHDIGCRKQKCAYILTKSSLQDLIGLNHVVQFVLPWDGNLSCVAPFSLGDQFARAPFPDRLCPGNLRPHLFFAVLQL